ncbi:DUF2252 family protein [Mucilaginibacter sp.]|uniref:DUF2252 domain-containing protein n=1 Tax=Mucilaginibacter sp. TaxID=1882438 RepID=UPI00284087B9|nr:DUF2252 family protein [Mucilaginibacter sp.]MDR3694321.1 DUF2252 family protein [Mucilaginibacter sp.]
MSTLHERITNFNKDRLPEIVQLKYKAMAQNVFVFLRGTCHLFYEDLSATKELPPSPLTWICGDLHPENFGSFKGDDRQEYFDLNDFDEAMLAPAAWELVRMVTSIFVAFESLGLKKEEALRVAGLFLKTYAAVLKNGKALSIDSRTAAGVVDDFLNTVKKRRQKELLKRLAVLKNGKFKALLLDNRHLVLQENLKKELIAHISGLVKNHSFSGDNFKVLDGVFRIAGTGSLGVKRYLFLLNHLDTKGKYLFLDMKQASSSSLKPYLKTSQPEWASEADRIIAVQKRMQNVPPALLHCTVFKNETYVLKQMQPIADKINFELLKDHYPEINKVITDMAMLTASAQLRSSGRQGSAIADDLIVFGEDNHWGEAVIKYAQRYAGQVNIDYTAFVSGFNKGFYQ